MGSDSKHFTQFYLSSLPEIVRVSNVADIQPRKFSIVMILTAANMLSHLVVHVLFMRPKPQVVRIYTRTIIPSGTVMKHMNTFWYGTVVKNPRSLVRSKASPANAILEPLEDRPIPAVFSGFNSRRPQPARISLFNLRPKPCRERFGKTLRSQIFRGNLDHSSVLNAVRVTGPAAFLIEKPTKRSKA